MRSPTIALVLASMIVACGGADEGSGDSPRFEPTAPDAVVLEIRDEGGFAPVEFILGRAPRYVLTADRLLHYQGPVPAIFPGPLLPNTQTVRVTEDDWNDIVRAIGLSGLPDIDLVENRDAAANVADATDTVVTLFDTNGEHVYRVYALGLGLGEQPTALVALQQLIADLDEATVNGEPLGMYETDRYELRFGDEPVGFDPEFVTIEPWPLQAAPETFPVGFANRRCAVVEGAELVSVVAALREATQTTVWDHEGTEWTMTARPLFPHEQGCS